VQFRSSETPPPHLDRRLQRRMLGYVGLIALAMIGLYAWRISGVKPGSSRLQTTKSPDEMDFDVRDEPGSGLEPDEFRILPREHKPRRNEADREASSNHDRSGALDVPRDWMSVVEDNTIGIRKHEADAYYRILAKAGTIPLQELQAHADRETLYVNLMTSPDTYRGKPITIVGELGKLFEFRVPENDYGLGTLYEAWIFTADSGNHPFRVVASSLPSNLRPGENQGQTVQATGYFFKREGYETPGGRLHVAPTLLAGRLSPYVSPQAPPPVEHLVPWMLAVVAAVGLAMLATVIGFAVSDRRANRWRHFLEPSATLDTVALSRADQRLSIEESLQRLADDQPLVDAEETTLAGNGHATVVSDLPDELIDLPTPFPPTRKRWERPN
jgi:hypothetical protein